VIPVYSLLLVCVLPLQLHTRPRVQWASGIPHALFGRKINAQLGRSAPRDREAAFGRIWKKLRLELELEHRHCERSEAIHLTFRREMDCFAALAMTVYNELSLLFEKSSWKSECANRLTLAPNTLGPLLRPVGSQ
jgi:hypothetical protein